MTTTAEVFSCQNKTPLVSFCYTLLFLPPPHPPPPSPSPPPPNSSFLFWVKAVGTFTWITSQHLEQIAWACQHFRAIDGGVHIQIHSASQWKDLSGLIALPTCMARIRCQPLNWCPFFDEFYWFDSVLSVYRDIERKNERETGIKKSKK